jgi:hypothetical protein
MVNSTASFVGILLYAVTPQARQDQTCCLSPGLACTTFRDVEPIFGHQLQASPDLSDWLDASLLTAFVPSFIPFKHDWSRARSVEIWPDFWLWGALFVTVRLSELNKEPRCALTTLCLGCKMLTSMLLDAMQKILKEHLSYVLGQCGGTDRLILSATTVCRLY